MCYQFITITVSVSNCLILLGKTENLNIFRIFVSSYFDVCFFLDLVTFFSTGYFFYSFILVCFVAYVAMPPFRPTDPTGDLFQPARVWSSSTFVWFCVYLKDMTVVFVNIEVTFYFHSVRAFHAQIGAFNVM